MLTPRSRASVIVPERQVALDADVADEAPLRAGAPTWLAFVNTDDLRRGDGGRRADVLLDFDDFVDWLQANEVLDAERAAG
ncbi:MAG: ABATE domain-containing protein, partial [Gemmatirosa sp.]